MKKFFCAFLLVAATALAAPAGSDLGGGLVYYRLHQLPSDLPPAPAQSPRATVLDLRYTTANADAATALDAWLKFRARATNPVFLLLNQATASAVLEMLAARPKATGLLTIGGTTSGFAPDIALAVPVDQERRAYDAVEQGAKPATLVAAPAGKPRHDEAELARSHQPPETATSDDSEPEKPAATPPPLVDLALQRAVQLHRTLVALRKIPAG